MNRGRLITRIVIGFTALTAWMLFFAGGLLVETVEYRQFLAPRAFAATSAPAASTITANTNRQLIVSWSWGAPAAKTPPAYNGTSTFAFFAAMLCFTPTNLVFVTLLAGLLGGCASNIVAENLNTSQLQQISSRRLMYLEETPWSAMMRSFIVYLCVIAGLYFAMDDPFKNSTPAQYMRLAGTLSLMAFVVGYDPSRIEQWLRLVPSPQPSQVVTIRDHKERIEMSAAQGPVAGQSPLVDGSEVTVLAGHTADDQHLSPPKSRKAK